MSERAPKLETAALPPIEYREWTGAFWHAAAAQAANEKHPEENQDVVVVDEQLGLITLCDGMGGHDGGREAATTVSSAVHEYFSQHMAEYDDHEALDVLPGEMIKAIRYAQSKLLSERGDEEAGGDTTVTSVLLRKLSSGSVLAIVGHVGNSRAYSIEQSGRVHQLTEDDDLMSTLDGAKLVMGDLPPDELARRRSAVRREMAEATSVSEMSEEARMLFNYRNHTMGVGGESMTVKVDVYRFPEEGGLALLSDGVHENIGRATGGYLSMVPVQPPRELTERVVKLAQENGHHRPKTIPTAHPDDMSTVIIRAI